MGIRHDVSTLKQQFEQAFPGKWGAAEKKQKTIFTGQAEIDRILERGLFRQRICEWTGPVSSGKTSFLRQVIASWTKSGTNVAYIDSESRLLACDWTFSNDSLETKQGIFWVVRPTAKKANPPKSQSTVKGLAPHLQESLWSAEQLIACRGFDVVILDVGSTPFISSRTYARLLKALQKSKTALLIVRDESPAFSSPASWGTSSHFNFRFGLPAQEEEGLAGVVMILPTVQLSVLRDGMSHNLEINLSTNGGSYVPNCLFTHPPAFDRRQVKN
jgi:hypothetical protein